MSPKTPAQNEQIRSESKHRIMDAAFNLIAKNGYESTSIAMIAKKAGVSKGLLYNYFTSKEELVKALVFGAMEHGEEVIAELLSKDPKQTLFNIIQWFFKEMRENHDQWRLITELTFKIEKFDFVHEIVATKMNEFIGALEAVLGQLGYEDPLGEARVLGAILDGVGVQALIVKEDYPMDEIENYLLKKYCE